MWYYDYNSLKGNTELIDSWKRTVRNQWLTFGNAISQFMTDRNYKAYVNLYRTDKEVYFYPVEYDWLLNAGAHPWSIHDWRLLELDTYNSTATAVVNMQRAAPHAYVMPQKHRYLYVRWNYETMAIKRLEIRNRFRPRMPKI